MANKPERIVLDTNIFIYLLISNAFQNFDKRLKSHRVKLLFSEELITEFLEVVSRPKFRKYFTDKDVTSLLDDLHNYSEYVEVHSRVNICRDKKDNFLLELCIDGKADYLITGDEDLLSISRFRKTSILKIADYLKI